MSVSNIYDDMWTGFDQFCEHTAQAAGVVYQASCEAVETTYNGACVVADSVGEEIENQYYALANRVVILTNQHLGYDAALFVQHAFYITAEVAKKSFFAAPITAAALLLPGYVTLPLTLGYMGAHLIYKDPFETWQYNALYTGQGNAYIVRTGKSILDFAVTRDPAAAVGAIINVFLAVLWYNKTITDGSPDGDGGPRILPQIPTGEIPREVPTEEIPVEDPRRPLEPSILELQDDEVPLATERPATPESEETPKADKEEIIHDGTPLVIVDEPEVPAEKTAALPEQPIVPPKETSPRQRETSKSRSRTAKESSGRKHPQAQSAARSNQAKEAPKPRDSQRPSLTRQMSASPNTVLNPAERPSVRRQDPPKVQPLQRDESTEEMSSEDDAPKVKKKKS